MIFVQVLPKSAVLKMYGLKLSSLCPSPAAYAVPASNGEASMRLIIDHSGTSLGVTLAQFLPPSRDNRLQPSSAPAHPTPSCWSDTAGVKPPPWPYTVHASWRT